ncbi:hypothetical protein BC941DRAFT_437056, partial [Chlamydoabsidia padenii]
MTPPPSNNVRQIFKQQQSQRQQQKKIDHVFAKYDRQGKLGCVLCHLTIKSEPLWGPHLQSAKHKELLAQLKAIKQQQQQQSEMKKRPLSDEQGSNSDAALLTKRARFEQIEKEMEQGDDGNDESADDDSDDSDMDEENDDSALPADFFDTPAPPPPPSMKLGVHRDLPNGFFDDANEEAKARQTAAPDEQVSQQLEEDYEAFKEMMVDTNEETDKMQEQDEEALLIDREVTLARQQLALDEKVQHLKRLRQQPQLLQQQEQKKETGDDDGWATGLKSSVRQTMMQQRSRKSTQSVVFDDMDDDDDDDDDELDWRAQHL